ncbi:unnamed protein product [Dicrocoelium dendriticum]|nr:unnamed protein product [Dicrocoelium dendriticum]
MADVEYLFSPVSGCLHASREQFTLSKGQLVLDEKPPEEQETLMAECSTTYDLENVLHEISSDDSYQPIKCWHSGSPSSSESTESFPSISFQSPGATDQSVLSSSLRIEAADANTRDIAYFSSNLLPSYVQLRDCVDLDSPEVPLYHSPTQITFTTESRRSPSQSADESVLQTSTQVAAADGHYYQEENTAVVWNGGLNRHTADRPHTLKLRKWNGSPMLPEQPLSFTSCSSKLEEQLASVDHAWFGALDMPNFNLEDVDLLLSPSNRLQSPNSENIPECFCERKDTKNAEAATAESQGTIFLEGAGQDTSASSSLQPELHSTKSAVVNSFGHHSAPDEEDGTGLEGKAVHSDDTLTCSEAEYYLKGPMKSIRRGRKYHRRRYGSPDRGNTSDSDFELGENETHVRHRRQSVGFQSIRCPKLVQCLSTPKFQNAQADSILKPWWPKNVPLLYKCEHSSDDSETNLKFDCVTNATPASYSRNAGPTDKHRQESDLPFITSKKDIYPRKKSGLKRNGLKRGNATKYPHEIRSRRRRKQMELWQFILCRLQTARQSAFQWVNPVTGVFRIADTLAGAREWGRYRSNNRMDYEKMARAMRFYYKDSILRKARQQLHFQFAMPYVEWATKYYQYRSSK